MPVQENGLSYGALESLLATLHECTTDQIRIRFRKLRMRPFPDEIRSGTGRRIVYDLPRTLAIASVFELNRMLVPQGQAVAIVEQTWPEWCRAAIAAAIEVDLLERPRAMPADAGRVLRLQPDAFAAGEPVWASTTLSQETHPAGPCMSIDLSRIVRAIASPERDVRSQDDLIVAFTSLEETFGWTRPKIPSRAEVAKMTRGRDFLDRGPYLDRAEALLVAPDTSFEPQHPAACRRLQAIFDYLEDPVPIDAWKAEIGTEPTAPRLKHLLHAYSVDRGLVPRKSLPATLLNSALIDTRERAIALVKGANR